MVEWARLDPGPGREALAREPRERHASEDQESQERRAHAVASPVAAWAGGGRAWFCGTKSSGAPGTA